MGRVYAGVALKNALDADNAATSKAHLEQGLTSEEAFSRIVRVSQNANIKVREIAQRYVGEWEGKSRGISTA